MPRIMQVGHEVQADGKPFPITACGQSGRQRAFPLGTDTVESVDGHNGAIASIGLPTCRQSIESDDQLLAQRICDLLL